MTRHPTRRRRAIRWVLMIQAVLAIAIAGWATLAPEPRPAAPVGTLQHP